MARCHLHRLWALVASTCGFLASVSSAIEWPYSELFRNEVSQVEKCAQVSGFSFRQNATPNVQQLARMCTDPDCSYLVDRVVASVIGSEPATVAAFSAFAHPVVNYCWFFQAPGDPCPVTSVRQFILRVKDKDASCESATGVLLSYDDDDDSMHRYGQVKKLIASRKACGVDCLPLLLRVWYLMDYVTCPKSDGSEYDFVNEMMWYCQLPTVDAGQPPEHYMYSPGWPLPTLPKPTSAPQATTSSSSSTGITETPTRTGPPLSEPPQATDYDNTVDPTEAQSTLAPSITKQTATVSNQSRAEDETDESVGSMPRRSRNTTGSMPLSNDDMPESSIPSSSDASTTSAVSHTTLVIACAAGVCTLLLVGLLIYMRRRRSGPSDKDREYSTVESPRQTTFAPSPREIEAVLGLQKLFPVQQAEVIRMIGSGGCGVVYLVRNTLNNQLLASKRLVPNQITDDKIKGFFDEIQTVSKLHHPRIVTFIGATWTNRTNVQALFEYMDGGDLRTYLETSPVTNTWTKDKLTIAIDIADALVHVHSELPTPLVHRDLKSRNVLLTKSPLRAKLSDFGVAREVSQNGSMTNGVGTSRWLAPEVILGRGDYGTACDIYSFGVVLSELDTHKIPFWNYGGDGLTSMVPEIAIMRIVAHEGEKPTFSASCPPMIHELALQCLDHDPKKRPTAIAVATLLREIVEVHE